MQVPYIVQSQAEFCLLWDSNLGSRDPKSEALTVRPSRHLFHILEDTFLLDVALTLTNFNI